VLVNFPISTVGGHVAMNVHYYINTHLEGLEKTMTFSAKWPHHYYTSRKVQQGEWSVSHRAR